MARSTSNLDSIAARMRAGLSSKHSAREKALQLSREAIYHCATAIRALHRGEFEAAQPLLEGARSRLAEIGQALVGHEDILYSGYVHDAQKEYAEACATLALIQGKPLPEPEALGVPYSAYLNGLGEAVGEMRRHLLDALRQGQVSRCEELLEGMDDIYTVLVTMDFPDALTGGLRRTTDMVRGVVERTRGDLTLALRQQELEQRLETFEGRLKGLP